MSTYNIIYEPDYARVIQAVNCDSTAVIPAIKNKGGNVIYSYSQGLIKQLQTAGASLYKVETVKGNLAGYFVLQTASPTGILFQQFRPAFQKVLTDINQNIANFINGESWQYDVIQ
jgi:hypothetical protein